MTDEQFKEWESDVFGYGYGSGERFVLTGMKDFFAFVPVEGTYDFEKLEKGLGSLIAWLFINLFCQKDVIEYGTSSRYGWLTENGKDLKKYVESKTVDELLEVMFSED